MDAPTEPGSSGGGTRVLEDCLEGGTRTRNLGGESSTQEVTQAVAERPKDTSNS